MGGSIALVQLTELKHQRMKQCAEFQQRSRWQPPYALTTALELQAIEIPRLPKGRAMLNGITVVVPSANERRNLVGINEVTWSFPVDVVMVEQCLCVSPACTWAMFAGWLNLEELIVLAESMMRRDGRLRRTTIEELTAYLDSAREFTEAVFEETGRRPNMFRGYANCRRALRVIQEGTDSSMETRTRLVPLKYGIDAPCVNYKIGVKRLNRAVYLDLAYPEYKICIEFDGGHHAGQWLEDARRRQAIEDEKWRYIQVTKLDLGDEWSEEALVRRIADKIQEVTGIPVPVTARKTIQQVCDARAMRRKPLYERIGFEPLLPRVPNANADFPDADDLDGIA